MPFHYTIEMLVNEPKAKSILQNEEIINLAEKNETKIEYQNGNLILTCAENQDLDEELVKKILSTISGSVTAKAYLIDGKSKIEIFNGKLDPKNPFGNSQDDIQERTIESIEEEIDDSGIVIDEDLEDFLDYDEEE
ncbi:hypothetical protein Ob7_02285 [Thermosipho africanus Ob7]|uniref:Uncharacterized protein n=1 Tax=Thermosipho africanus (strain TCF52B) TaxID=484019 RepID=B7IEV4_THEAB|nr:MULTISPECIES: hypothetical protein [Thermosipho]HCF37687.1 hypothetical protein [Thermosipho africanus]ACJ74618.1 hypothetical protein THA_110 [Thermosipho africanus TCF52B]MBZ4649647.1 hypothetical protein [Thermosipho sp. (in: thermotogales)]MDK2839265.1 hypothetical protein [Thermosipho sp. (in: thermotogales)]MDK2900873.1 hypothetical protein [Thermosipho sp. (in: thermotogales)]